MSETTRSASIDGAPARASLMDWLAVAAGTIGMFATPLVLLLRPKAPDEEAVERTETALQHSCQHELY